MTWAQGNDSCVMDRQRQRQPISPASGLKRHVRLFSAVRAHVGMSPRKKSKPNPTAPADASSSSTSTGPQVPADGSTANLSSITPNGSEILQNTPLDKSLSESAATTSNSVATSAPSEQSQSKSIGRKWLAGSGSWRSKAPPIVKTAKESIGSSQGTTSELPSEESKKPKDDSPTKFLKKRNSSKSDAIPASMTKLNVSSDGAVNEMQEPKADEPATEAENQTAEEPPLPPEPPKNLPASTFGWRSWWSRPDGYSETSKTKEVAEINTQDAQNTPLPGVTPSEEVAPNAKQLGVETQTTKLVQEQEVEPKDVPMQSAQDQNTETKDDAATDKKPAAKPTPTSWFRLWSSAQNARSNPPSTGNIPTLEETPESKPDEDSVPNSGNAPQEVEPVSDPATTVPPPGETRTQGASKPTGWAFWFSGKSDTNKAPDDGSPQKHVGEVAVFNTPSQSHPEAAQFNEQEQPPKDGAKETAKEPPKPPAEESASKISFRSLRGRPKAKDMPRDTPTETPSSSKAATPSKASPVLSPTHPELAPATQAAPKQDVKAKQEPPNLILPEFKNTYHLVQQPSFWKQLRQYFLGGEPAMPHLHINPAPPRIKKAVAIGVHGFFPAPIFQRVLGQPTGTSIRFANAAATAIKDWTEARGYTPEIEQVALEGEGFIAERVNTLWKLLLNWIEHIKAADFILVACHSQGVPVAIMLVAKLIQFGCVNASRIGVCAMAGVNMGPFIEYKTKYFGPTAAELFEFSNPKSLVSQMYLAALDEVLRFGVRIMYVGSIDDQLVSVESSTFSTLSHPYIYRAVFVDGRIHAPDFLSHLVGFTLKLRNLGLPDHGLIRELSPALAGSLYAGEGHSRVYEDPRVYELAIQHALETTSLPVQPQQRPSTSASFQGINIPIIGDKGSDKDVHKLRVKEYESTASANQNPYFLPWAMRGLLEEDFVKKELGDEVEELLNMFESWKPQGKLKDVKFRLEGVRSKL